MARQKCTALQNPDDPQSQKAQGNLESHERKSWNDCARRRSDLCSEASTSQIMEHDRAVASDEGRLSVSVDLSSDDTLTIAYCEREKQNGVAYHTNASCGLDAWSRDKHG